MIDKNLNRLIKWYYNLHNGKWRHGNAIEINTIDNPGLCLWIYLDKTDLQDKQFDKIVIERTEEDWLHCYIEDKILQGVGGIFNFSEILQILLNWIEDKNEDDIISLKKTNKVDNFTWLLDWYYSQCDGDWEHSNGFEIKAIDPGWSVRISIYDTELEKAPFQELYVNRSEQDWVHCFKYMHAYQEFVGTGGPSNLIEILQIFRDWAEKYQVEDDGEV